MFKEKEENCLKIKFLQLCYSTKIAKDLLFLSKAGQREENRKFLRSGKKVHFSGPRIEKQAKTERETLLNVHASASKVFN